MISVIYQKTLRNNIPSWQIFVAGKLLTEVETLSQAIAIRNKITGRI